jgi:hypothetical protein
MATRREQEVMDVARYLPSNTRLVQAEGRDIWIFTKQTEMFIEFEIAIYYDLDERGYCAQLVRPDIENAWKNAHVGHVFFDGVICFGGDSMRTRRTLREAFAKACLWSEGMAIMIFSHVHGTPCEFPFSMNNLVDEAHNASR